MGHRITLMFEASSFILGRLGNCAILCRLGAAIIIIGIISQPPDQRHGQVDFFVSFFIKKKGKG